MGFVKAEHREPFSGLGASRKLGARLNPAFVLSY